MGRKSTAEMGPTARPASREAAVVALYRRTPELSLFRVRRAPQLAYLGGFHAFPGGAVQPADAAVALAGVSEVKERARRVSAARELFEEVGVLLGQAREARAKFASDDRRRERGALDRGELPFAKVLEMHGVELLAEAFLPAGRWISPPFLPRAFDTYFYLVELPPGEETGALSGELDDGEWVTPARGLDDWRRGESLLATPVRRAFEILKAAGGRGEPAEWALAMAESPEARGGAVERIEVTPGAVLIPLRTLTLAPATHTNCLVLGEGECLLVDPGSEEESELAALEKGLDALARDGRRVTAIAATHHHGDHLGGVEAMRQRLGAPVLAHPALAERLRADRVLRDGEVMELASVAGEAWRIEARFAPGHTRDHVVYWEAQRGVLAAGDLLSGLGTVVIDPPDGDLGDYMTSLQALRDLPMRVLLPGHGPPMGGGVVRVEKLLAHRRWREERVLASLGETPLSLEQLVQRVYDDVEPEVWRLAQRSLLAHLLHLEARQLAKPSEMGGQAGWSRSPSLR